MRIKAVTVSVSSRRQGRPYESEENFSSFLIEKEEGPFTPEEAILAKTRMTLILKRLTLLDELAQGLVDKDYYDRRSVKLEERYSKILEKMTGNPECFLKDPKVSNDS